MAQSDRKRTRRRGGGGSSYNYDADARASSKYAYDRIKEYGDAKAYFDNLGDIEFLRKINTLGRISRYGSTDLERVLGSMSQQDRDAIMERLAQAKADKAKADAAESERWRQHWKEQGAIRVARETEEANAIRQQASLSAGMLRSDLHDVYEVRAKTGQYYGDWMDDPVALLTGGDGWGRSVKESAGIKIQITLSLDASNSMWYNNVAADAVKAFIELGMALDEMVETFPGSVFANQFVFALHEEGKQVTRLTNSVLWAADNAGNSIGKYEYVRSWMQSQPYNAGEDTWINPLFCEIEAWENNESDPGAVRLDLVLTDAVLEHPMDVREAGRTQERRDGALQTILLNFLPEEDWLNGALPAHTVQYPANGANVAGLLRRLLAEFVSVYY